MKQIQRWRDARFHDCSLPEGVKHNRMRWCQNDELDSVTKQISYEFSTSWNVSRRGFSHQFARFPSALHSKAHEVCVLAEERLRHYSCVRYPLVNKHVNKHVHTHAQLCLAFSTVPSFSPQSSNQGDGYQTWLTITFGLLEFNSDVNAGETRQLSWSWCCPQ